MRVLDIEILQYLDGGRTVVLRSGRLIEYILQGENDIIQYKLILVSNGEHVIFIFFAKKPAVNSFRYGYLLLFV